MKNRSDDEITKRYNFELLGLLEKETQPFHGNVRRGTIKRCACGKPRMPGQRRCWDCHAEDMRRWRKTHPQSAEQRRKSNLRALSRHYAKTGRLKPLPCQYILDDGHICGAKAQRHHPTYDDPLNVLYLCKHHHLQLHGKGSHTSA